MATNSEDVFWSPGEDGQDVGTYVEKVSYWPALAKRPRPEWLRQHAIEGIGILTGESLCSTLHELYQALDGDMNVLAAIGVRTCFDIASEILGVDGALTFEEKLKTLVASSHIRLVDADRLAVAVDAGHASAHRGWKPNTVELATITKILEDFIFDAFVRPDREAKLVADAAKVRDRVPPKRRRLKAKPVRLAPTDENVDAVSVPHA